MNVKKTARVAIGVVSLIGGMGVAVVCVTLGVTAGVVGFCVAIVDDIVRAITA